MVNFKLGKIYKIVCDNCNKIYIGSTCEPYLSRRLAGHKVYFKKWILNENVKYISSIEIFLESNFKDIRIILIENFPCNSRDELRAREDFFIRKFKDDGINIVNIYNAVLNVEKLKAYQKNYRIENKEKQKELHKKHRKTKKYKINHNEYNKKYKKGSKFKTYRKQYRASRKKFECDCGSITSLDNKSRHFKSKKHLNFISQ